MPLFRKFQIVRDFTGKFFISTPISQAKLRDREITD